MRREKYPEHVFPSRLRNLMVETKTTQRKLAQAIGVRPQTVSLYTQGRSFPDVNGLDKIASFFCISADYLIGLTDNPKPHLSFCKYSKLSEKAIRNVKRLGEQSLDGLNKLLEGLTD